MASLILAQNNLYALSREQKDNCNGNTRMKEPSHENIISNLIIALGVDLTYELFIQFHEFLTIRAEVPACVPERERMNWVGGP